jgi:hypothetical protein
VQLTPPGSQCSIHFGNGLTTAVPGPDRERRSYGSYASFSDPDGNRWVLQEVTTRLPDELRSFTSLLSPRGVVGPRPCVFDPERRRAWDSRARPSVGGTCRFLKDEDGKAVVDIRLEEPEPHSAQDAFHLTRMIGVNVRKLAVSDAFAPVFHILLSLRCRPKGSAVSERTRQPSDRLRGGYNCLIRTFRNFTVPAPYWRAIGPSTCFVSFTSTTFAPLRTTVNCEPFAVMS